MIKILSPFLLYRKFTKKNRHGMLASLVFMLLMNFSSFSQNSANIIVTPASTTTNVGQSFTVTVKVDFTTAPATSSVDAVEVHLTFDKTKLAVASITKPSSGIMGNEAIPLQTIGTINTNGQINYAAFTLSNFPTADFDLLSITFNAIAASAPTTPLTFLTTFPNKTDAQRNGSTILGSVGNAVVTVQNCTPPTATIAAAASSSICNGQPIGLSLSAATGVSPYSIVVNGTTYSATVGATFATIPFPTYRIWPSTNPSVTTQNDGGPIETGTKFRTSQSGFVKGIRFYTGNTVTGTFKGKLWNYNTGALLASITYSSVTANGWQEIMFAQPVSIAANTTYLASMYSSVGNYVSTDGYFNSAVTSGPLTALANSTSPNGTYFFGAEQSGPTTNFGNWGNYISSNYWVDVVFVPNTASFALTSVTDANGCVATGSPLQTLNVLSVDCSTLPVTLLNLSAAPASNKVTLRWSTSSEINNLGFEVQRSTTGTNWTTIGFVAGAGNSSTTKSYSYVDNNLEPKKYYYQLKQIDIDQRYKYSSIVSATLNSKAEFSLGQNFPNPVKGQATIQFTVPRTELVNITLFDMNGRVLKTLVNGSRDAGSHVISFNAGNLAKGVYYYKMQAGEFTDAKKISIQ